MRQWSGWVDIQVQIAESGGAVSPGGFAFFAAGEVSGEYFAPFIFTISNGLISGSSIGTGTIGLESTYCNPVELTVAADWAISGTAANGGAALYFQAQSISPTDDPVLTCSSPDGGTQSFPIGEFLSLSNLMGGGIGAYSFDQYFSFGPLNINLVPGYKTTGSTNIGYSQSSSQASISGSSVATATITLAPAISVSCYPKTQLTGLPTSGPFVSCMATVTGDQPSGNVKWVTQLAGIVSPPTECTLDQGLVPSGDYSTCVIQVWGHVKGTATITATYLGDQNNQETSGTATVKFVTLKPTHIKLSCVPSQVSSGSQSSISTSSSTTTSTTATTSSSASNSASASPALKTTCVAKVSSYAASSGKATSSTSTTDPPLVSPTGTVEWNESLPIGTFSNSSCTLIDGTCSVEFSQNVLWPVSLTASYSGDTNDSSGYAVATTAPIISGSAVVDQTQSTGLNISLSGTSGSIASVSSTYYLTQPNDTGTALFSNQTQYFDVNVANATGGSALICYYGPEVNSSTSMDYYFNGVWSAASNIQKTNGEMICGSVPVSSLSGTPLAIGVPNAPSPVSYLTFAAVIAIIIAVAVGGFLAVRRRRSRQPDVLQHAQQSNAQPSFCRNCGSPIVSNFAFCRKCGKRP